MSQITLKQPSSIQGVFNSQSHPGNHHAAPILPMPPIFPIPPVLLQTNVPAEQKEQYRNNKEQYQNSDPSTQPSDHQPSTSEISSERCTNKILIVPNTTHPDFHPNTHPNTHPKSQPTTKLTTHPSNSIQSPLIPPTVRQRRFRADSFAAKLKPEQLIRLFGWFETHGITEIQRKVAAPAPEGFGLPVNQPTLRRLRTTYDNTELNGWMTEAMDTACDTLESDTGAAIAPLRESLLLLLYTRAINASRKQADIPSIDRLVASIARLERIRSRASHPGGQPSTSTRSAVHNQPDEIPAPFRADTSPHSAPTERMRENHASNPARHAQPHICRPVFGPEFNNSPRITEPSIESAPSFELGTAFANSNTRCSDHATGTKKTSIRKTSETSNGRGLKSVRPPNPEQRCAGPNYCESGSAHLAVHPTHAATLVKKDPQGDHSRDGRVEFTSTGAPTLPQ